MLIAIHPTIPSTPLSYPDNLEVVNMEIGCVKPITLCLVYFPPNTTAEHGTHLLDYPRHLSVSVFSPICDNGGL